MWTDYTSKDVERFWAKVAITADDEKCWEWQAYRDPNGYGQMSWSYKSKIIVYSHRISYLLVHGDYLDELYVLHKCDNPSCVNPKHLFLGTHLDNIRDMYDKGRYSLLAGEKSGQHKYSDEFVATIRRRYAQENITQTQLGIELGVGSSYVSRIVNRKMRTYY